jgi:peptide methionine sulfoxide reductase MsrB
MGCVSSTAATSSTNITVQQNLRWNVNRKTADRICNFNRHYAEQSGYLTRCPEFLEACKQAEKTNSTITFYDSNTGKPLFEAPKNRTMQEFLAESKQHGWPSFRDAEVNRKEVRCLRGGEVVSLAGTHLGHNLPDRTGNRYCINLVSVAGNPVDETEMESASENDTTSTSN